MEPDDEGSVAGAQQACHSECALDLTSEAGLLTGHTAIWASLAPGLMWRSPWWGNCNKFTHTSSLKGQVGTRSPYGSGKKHITLEKDMSSW